MLLHRLSHRQIEFAKIASRARSLGARPLGANIVNAKLKIVRRLSSLRKDQRGTIAVMMAFLFPVLIAGLGLGFEITNWYLRTRSMQNAADAAAIAAAANASANYNVEAAAVAARYGYVNGTNNVTVTASNAAACPADPSITPPCYSVTISSVVPLFLTEVIGYTGNSALNGARQQSLTSAAVATTTTEQEPVCLLALDPTSGITAFRSNGGPKADFSGCTIMSNASATCNGNDLDATWGLAHGTNNGCGNNRRSGVPMVSDPYAYMASNIPNDLPAKCSNTYPQESKQGNNWSGGTAWAAGTKTLTGTASLAGNTLICGDLRLTGDVTIDAPNGAVLYIENGLLDLQGHTLRTANGSSVTIVFTGDPNSTSYNHIPTDNKNGGGGVLNIEAPKTGPFHGVAIYQDPALTHNVDISYAGNSPTWDLTGAVYLPKAQVTISGAINKSANGAVCMMMVAKDVLINGTGMIYAQSPDGSGCKDAGLDMPTATIPGRSKLVF
jgi:Flp pilus assembly protein TadG